MNKQRVSEKNHGVQDCYYANGPYGLVNVMECLCGWGTSPCYSWESAGEELDNHLKEITNG